MVRDAPHRRRNRVKHSAAIDLSTAWLPNNVETRSAVFGLGRPSRTAACERGPSSTPPARTPKGRDRTTLYPGIVLLDYRNSSCFDATADVGREWQTLAGPWATPESVHHRPRGVPFCPILGLLDLRLVLIGSLVPGDIFQSRHVCLGFDQRCWRLSRFLRLIGDNFSASVQTAEY